MSKRALLVSVMTALAVITAGCDDEMTSTDGGMTTQDGGTSGDIDGGMTGDIDGGTTGDDDGGTTGDVDSGMTGDEDGGTGDEDGGTGDEDGGMTGDVCGDGVVTGAETCDSAIEAGMPGACPTSCDDGLACTTDTLVGEASSCDVECTTVDITTCTSGDGCCPSGCTMDDDDDCACTPRTTCAAGECGTVDDGCGNPLDCGACATGGACTDDADCAGDGECFTAEDGWADGYCTAACFDDTDCGAGAHCIGGDAASATVGACLADCTSDADCRSAGYSCQDLDGDSVTECFRSATGTGAIGASCMNDAGCAGGDDGLCLLETGGWQQGYCSVFCETDTDCGAGAHCASNGICLADCSTDSDCRAAGYTCSDVDSDTVSECYPSATGTGVTGAACEQTFECAGGDFGLCLSGGSLLDGYCSAGCLDDTDCTAGGHCSEAAVDGFGIVGVCTDSCTTDGDCRTGYSCHDVDGNGTSECWAPPATGTGAIGAACTDNSDCAGGTAGYCHTESPGGTCTQHCGTADLLCPTGSLCVDTGAGIRCAAECTGSGMGDCRSGYTCAPLTSGDTVCL